MARSIMQILREARSAIYSAFQSEDHLPCYINRVTVVDQIDKMALIREYIEAAKDAKVGRIGVLLFSVTENDKYYKKWLKVAEEEGYQVVSGPSIHGDYQCWSIFVPNEKLGDMRHR